MVLLYLYLGKISSDCGELRTIESILNTPHLDSRTPDTLYPFNSAVTQALRLGSTTEGVRVTVLGIMFR